MDDNKIKMYLYALSAILLALGQYFILVPQNYPLGITFSLLFIVIFIMTIAGLYSKAAVSVIAFIKAAQLFIKDFNSRSLAVQVEKSIKIKPGKVQEKIKVPGLNPFKKNTEAGASQAFDVKFSVPKVAILVVAVIIFILVQFFFFKQRLMPAMLSLIISISLFYWFFTLKTEKVDYEIKLERGLKLILLAAGAGLIIAGWIFLTKRTHGLQNIGVGLTTVGIFMAYFGLPRNEMEVLKRDENEDILFSNFKFMHNPAVKIILMVLVFIFLNAGNFFLNRQDLPMLSMFFYALMGGCLFFSMPWIDFKEKYEENKMLDIVKLVCVLIAMFVAYNAQMDFTKNKLVSAVIQYLVAASVFIIAFPIYAKKEREENFPLWVEFAFVGGITLFSLWLRTYQLDIRPIGLENDEAGGMVSIIKNFWVGQHPIYAYFQEMLYKVFGVNRIGMRMSGVIIGTIAIPAMYFAARALFRPTTAMFVTVAFTFLRWNLHFGRSGHGTILMIIAETIAVYFIIKAIQKRDKLSYFMAGLGSGLCWYGVLTGWFVVLAPMTYFIVEGFKKAGFYKKNIVGILVFLLGFWIFGSQHIKNFFISQNTYFGRINEVSVFSKDPNAPIMNPAKGIVDNTKRVLLMFNHQGDSRQRNSGGQPYEPTVDFVTAMFFAIGLLYALYYSKYYAYFILIMIFFSQAAGSIFSIEAPSAMRAVGTMIPVILFAGLTFEKLFIAFRRVLGDRWRKIFVPLLLAIPLFFIIKDNYNQYFGRWVGGFDELSTVAGMYSEKLGKSYRIFLSTGMYYPGHPPYRVYRWDYKVNSSSNHADGIANLSLIDDEHYAVFFHADTWDNRDYLKDLFPKAKWDEYSIPSFGKQLEIMMISNEEIAAIRGLKAKYVLGNTGAVVTSENDLPEFTARSKEDMIPYKASWSGSLLLPYFAKVDITTEGNVQPAIWIDGERYSEGKSYKLGKGFHAIRIEASRNSTADRMKISMLCRKAMGMTVGSPERISFTKNYLYNVRPQGFHVYYYSGELFDKVATINEEIAPTAYFPGRPVNDAPSVKFSGYLNVDQAGLYKFKARENGYIKIVIDNKYYTEDGNNPNEVLSKVGSQRVVDFQLSKGRHKIDIYSLNSAILYLTYSINNSEPKAISPSMIEPDFFITR